MESNNNYNGRFDKIDASLEVVNDKLENMHVVQVEHAKDIKYHIARTDALEKMVTPLHRVYLQTLGVLKVAGAIIALAGALKAILYCIQYFS